MADNAQTDERMTVAEFMNYDDGTERRLELVDGRPVAMNPPSGRHAIMSMNISRALDRQLTPPCRSIVGGGVSHADESRTYRVPDVLVSCIPPKENFFDEPRLIVEVLSPSTAKEDRTDKLDFYKTFPSLEAVLMVWQDTRRVEMHEREGVSWRVRDVIGNGTVHLVGLGIDLQMDEIYA